MKAIIHKYLSQIGRSGGRKSRRKLDRQTAKNMVRVREARRAFKKFHAQCFWSFDPDYKITLEDVDWVIQTLMENGGRDAWGVGTKLCH